MDKFVICGQEAFLLNQKRKNNEYENSESGESSFKPQSKEILIKKKSDDKKHKELTRTQNGQTNFHG